MSRKGPKKVTRREDRDLERRAERSKGQTAAVRAKTEERALVVYKAQSNPNIPSNKGERRALRQALSAEGVSMERWSSGNFEECFFHIAKDRYVNNRYPTIECNYEEEGEVELESDPWLQMYLHLPVDYREKVSDLIENVNPPEAPSKPKTAKMSQRQAKDLAEGIVVPSTDVSACASVEDFKVVTEEVETKVPFAADLFKKEEVSLEVPTGAVSIRNSRDEALCADAVGRVEWRLTSGSELGSTWTLQRAAAATEGKFTLRSAHGLFLSHCVLWGFVADRSAASTWEQFEVSVREEGAFSVKSWRGMYMNCSGNKVVPSSSADMNSVIKIEKVE